jgi:hypothetical protein
MMERSDMIERAGRKLQQLVGWILLAAAFATAAADRWECV